MHRARDILLNGRVVLPDGGARQRFILIRGGTIRSVSRSRPPARLVEGALEITAGPQDWVFPGLIDLHSHTGYNFLPLWRSARAPFANRHEWRGNTSYRTEVNGVRKEVRGHMNARKVFSEIQSVAGGTTLLDEPRPLDNDETEGSTILCRNTGDHLDLGLSREREIPSVVDFFVPGPVGPQPARGYGGRLAPIDDYTANRATRQAHLVHLAEGRSGFGSYRGVDPYTRAEFKAFMAHPAFADVEAVRASRLCLVHCCGTDTASQEHLDFLAERDIRVIWSPASNMLLYDDTLDVEPLIQHGIRVALGSDWSPSGSKHVWEEAKFARFFLSAIGSAISNADVFKMVTSVPADCLGLSEFGRIKEGAPADFFILRSPIESDSALEVFFSTSDSDVLATVVAGLPIYGDTAFLQQFETDLQPLPSVEGAAVANKSIHLPVEANVDDFAEEVDSIEQQLKALNPPVYRSNLLVSSDVPYQRRFHRLRARVERFGWTVRRFRQVEFSLTPGHFPVDPDAVILTEMRGAAGREALVQELSESVLPGAVQLAHRHGLTALLAATAGRSAPETAPAALVLLAFERAAAIDRFVTTLPGRALSHFVAHHAGADWVQEGRLRPLPETNGSDGSFYLLDAPTDWHTGSVRVYRVNRSSRASAEAFREAAHRLLRSLPALVPTATGLAARVSGDHVAVFARWDSPEYEEIDLSALGELGSQETSRDLDTVNAKTPDTWPYKGFEMKPSDCMRAEFDRRGLMPW